MGAEPLLLRLAALLEQDDRWRHRSLSQIGRMTEPALEIHGVSKRFVPDSRNDDISLSLGKGEIVALLGENGAGKTTLMNILFGHYMPDAGASSSTGVTFRRASRAPPPGRHRHGASAFLACPEPHRFWKT